MIDINQLKPGDIVRSVVSGNAYVVQCFPRCGSVIAVRVLEISNPQEWERVDVAHCVPS